MKFKLLLILFSFLGFVSQATTYEDAEDGLTIGWSVFDQNPVGATVSNFYDNARSSQVIQFQGSGDANGYRLQQSDGSNWGNSNEFFLQWSQNFSENHKVFVRVNTDLGWRYIMYLPLTGNSSQSSDLKYIYHRLGSNFQDGTWKTITRDLEADLKALEPMNNLISVEQFLVRGTGLIDDIQLLAEMPSFPVSVYEDAEDGLTSGWSVFDQNPAGATISNFYDISKSSQVIQLQGSGIANGYRLQQSDGTNWGNSNQAILQWSQNFSENHKVFVSIKTDLGSRYLMYLPLIGNSSQSSDLKYIYHRLGTNLQDGTWQTITRNLEADLKALEPTNNLISVEQFLVRGTGLIDDIQLLAEMPSFSASVYEDAEDGLTSGWSIFDQNPAGATVSNFYDSTKSSQVIQLQGSGIANGYRLQQTDGSNWGNSYQSILQWSQNFSESHKVFVSIETDFGSRYLMYLPIAGNSSQSSDLRYIYHRLGTNLQDGTWQTITRDLEADLKALEPTNNLISAEQFLVRGSGMIDDISLSSGVSECSATAASENAYVDSFVNDQIADTNWPGSLNYVALTVSDIESTFNAARANDNTITTQLVMPTQTEWDTYSNSQKALYLINSERCARGIRPFEGVDLSLETSPAQTYADYLVTFGGLSHTADGRTPWQRMTLDAGVQVGTNADFFSYGENLAYQSVGSSGSYPTVHSPIVKAVYGWIYADKDDTMNTNTGVASYGHRLFALATGLTENSGSTDSEGLIAIGVATEQFISNGFYWTRVYSVMNGFDPNSNWDNDLENIVTVPIYGN